MGQTTWERRERREKAGMFSNEKDKDWKKQKRFRFALWLKHFADAF